jgi:hypothetical protein
VLAGRTFEGQVEKDRPNADRQVALERDKEDGIVLVEDAAADALRCEV